jgi:membrane protein DedA with SNARE-associated domain/membrane-associated phospholipid phosphatase
MLDNINPLLQWLNLHPNLAGLVTFIISASESIAIIGTIIPGTITMTAIGTLIGTGVIPLWTTFIWAILGAITGDNISFWIGFYFKDNLHRTWPFRSYPNLLISGENFFRKHGFMSVVIGRFIGPTRAIVPVVAGMLSMKPLRFIFISVLASSAWAPAYMLPGILLGEATMELPPEIATQMVLRLVLSALFISLCLWISYRIFILIRKQINQLLTTIWHKLLRSRHFHIITSLLKHHNIKQTHGQLTLAFYFILCVTAFCYLSLYIFWHHSQDIMLNRAIFYIFRIIRNPSTDDVMLWITLLGDKTVLIPTVGVLIGFLALKKNWHTAYHAFALLLLTTASVSIFKHLIHSVRPWGIVNSPEDFSFPSGHTTLSTTFYISLGLLLAGASNLQRRWLPFLLIATLVTVISISRLYLGAHWFTDVMGGWILSATLLTLIGISYNRKAEKHLNVKDIFITTIISLLIFLGVMHHHNYHKLQTNYAEAGWPTYNIRLDNWWAQHADNLPPYRSGLLGTRVELLNLQWLGNLDNIKTQLMRQGWELPPERGWMDVLHRITDISSAEHLPIVSPLYLDRKPALVLIKNFNGDKRPVVLRLWNSNINIIGTKPSQALWVGVIAPVPRTYSWLITYKRNNDININPTTLFSQWPAEYVIKEQNVMTDLKHRQRMQHMLLVKQIP